MGKRVVSVWILFLLIISIINPICVVADSSDSEIQTKIDELWNMFGDTYFTVDRSTGCGVKSSGHYCSNCYTPNIVATTWFKNLFGNVSANQFPHTYYKDGEQHGRPGWSCFGFASFAEWYIFKTSNTDTVDTYHVATKEFTYANISTYAKKGDLIRLHNGGDGGHSVIYIGATSSGIQVIHSNWSGEYNCKVRKDTIRYDGSNYDYAYFTISRATNRNVTTNTEPPSNVTISADRYECNVGETVNLYYTIDNAWNSAYLVLYYNNENHFVYVNGSPGTVSYTFTEAGRYYIYTKGSNDYGTSDCNGIWITVNEIPPTNVTISAIDRTYCVGETITLNYTIDRAWNSSYIVLYYNNENHYVYFNGSLGSVEYTFTEPGHYYIYTKGSNDAGTSDCYGLHIDVNEPMNLGDDFYAYIINPYSNMAVIHDNSNNAVIWERDNSYEQLWHFKRHNDGSYKITSVKSGLCLDVSNSSSETDAKVQVWEDNETTAQKWFIHSDGTNYRLRAMCTEYVLDIKNAIYTNGTELQTVNEHGDPAQRFYIQKSETFTITYNSNEKNSVITHQTKSNLIDIVLSTNIPIRDGYKFTGWNTKVDGTGITYNPGAIYTENNNLVLYAQWEELIPHSESTVTKSGAKLIIDTKVHNITAPYEILIVGYKENRLVTMKRVPHDEQNSPYTLEGDIDKIKVMVWNGLSNLKPLCDAEVIPHTEFITE